LKTVKITTANAKLSHPPRSYETQVMFKIVIIFSRSIRITPLITREKSPRVRIMKGKPNILRIGLTNVFRSQSTIPATK
jgi:hypothetical protein